MMRMPAVRSVPRSTGRLLEPPDHQFAGVGHRLLMHQGGLFWLYLVLLTVLKYYYGVNFIVGAMLKVQIF